MAQKVTLLLNDCVEAMKDLDENSVRAVVCDPPNGTSFMAKKWDDMSSWKTGVSASSAEVIRDTPVDIPSDKTSDDDETDIELTSLTDIHAQQAWHLNWLREAYRVLKPGGIIKAFSATRTFHRLAAAMQDAGFERIGLEAWVYGSGFPKSYNISKKFESMGKHDLAEKYKGYGTALKPAWEPFVIGYKPMAKTDDSK